MPASRSLPARTRPTCLNGPQYRRLSIFVFVRRRVGLCAVFPRHPLVAAGRGVFVGTAQPGMRLSAGLAATRSNYGPRALLGFLLVLASIFGVQQALAKN